jgi:hypothetical protein
VIYWKFILTYPLNLEMYFLGVCKFRQDRQCTYNVTLWRVRVTIVAVENKKRILCFFPHCLKWHDFREKFIEREMSVLIFFTTSVRNIYSKKNSARYHKFTLVFVWSTLSSYQFLIQLEFPQHIFQKVLKYQISLKSVQCKQACSMRAGRHNEANSRFS